MMTSLHAPTRLLRLRRQQQPLLRAAWRCQASRSVVMASWGPPPTFQRARVSSNTAAAEGLRSLLLDVPPTLAAGYTVPGQYVQVRVSEADKPAFIALSAPVGAHSQQLELLVKSQPGTAELLCALSAGAELEVSQVLGRGFQLASVPAATFPDLFLFATGSGLSPVRALLETPVEKGGLGLGAGGGGRRPGQLHLYVGVRTPAHLAFRERIAAWEAAGLRVTRVYSEEGGGYVQDAFLAAQAGSVNGATTAAVLVGQKGMAEALTASFAERGIPKERLLSNF